MIFATWASSAPVEAQVDMSSYYKAAERSLTRNCSADWVAVTAHVDALLSSTNTSLVTDTKYALEFARLSKPGGNTTLAEGLTPAQAAKMSDVDAAGILMDPLNFYQYYGFNASLLPFCNLLETRNGTATPLEEGVVSGNGGVDAAFDAFLVAIGELDYDSIPGDPDDPVTDMSWMWQYCSEYGVYLARWFYLKSMALTMGRCRILPARRSGEPTFHRDLVPFSRPLPGAVQRNVPRRTPNLTCGRQC